VGFVSPLLKDNGGIRMTLSRLATTDNRHRLLLEQEMAMVVSIESELLKTARQYFDLHGFTEVTTPHITKVTGSCENIDTLFGLDYFGEEAYLVQTGQLYLEALIPSLGNVFCVGPSFRAEPTVDSRHLTEFVLLEIEFPGNFNELLSHIENIVYSMVKRVLHNRKHELELLGVDTDRLKRLEFPFRRMSYTRAVELLNRKGIGIAWGDDLKSSQEGLLVGDGVPTFITHFPEEIKFFNMRRNEKNPKVVNSADLILPYSGEAVGAAEREHDYRLLQKKLLNSEMYRKLKKRGKSIDDFRWYLEVVREKSVRHAGCGIGLNRVTQFILGTDDIRISTAYPMNKASLM
jgi:asparaginyl-tRNA synthetase